jgi:hypothetical protein
MSRDDLKRLALAASGGSRVADPGGRIRLDNGDWLCMGDGSIDGVEWLKPEDLAFTVQATPYEVHCLIQEAESAERRCAAYVGLLRSLGVDPARVLEFMRQPEPASVDEAPEATTTRP